MSMYCYSSMYCTYMSPSDDCYFLCEDTNHNNVTNDLLIQCKLDLSLATEHTVMSLGS